MDARDTCSASNHYDGGNLGARISSIFVIFAVSAIGSFLPVIAQRSSNFKAPTWIFFIVRYIGSGVIIATGFMHLLADGHTSLTDPCLGGVFDVYPWAEAICLMGVFTMFVFDLLAHQHMDSKIASRVLLEEGKDVKSDDENEVVTKDLEEEIQIHESPAKKSVASTKEAYLRILNSLMLEFGIVFHSVFVGLSLAIAGTDFVALYVAIAFHQLFEGLGLGTRFALTPWPKGKEYAAWLLCFVYSLTTPCAIAIGIGVRTSYQPGSRSALVAEGVINSLCAGILIYNSLVELMAYDFLYSTQVRGAGQSKLRSWLAVLCVAIGAGAMALIGRWA